ncbi:MAG: hypothetical protein SGILL_006198 [Bacillariaceae sp.]
MASPARQDEIEPVAFGGHEQQAQQHQQQAQMMAFLQDTSQQQPAPQQQHQLQHFPPSIHLHQQQQVNIGAHAAAFPPLMHPPIHIPTRDDDANPPPGMISIAKHEHEMKMLRASHEDTVRRLNTEISDLKRRVKIAKENEKETKRRHQEKLKEIHKNGNKRQRLCNMEHDAPHNKHGIKWRERYDELKAFVEVHGHANVSKKEEQYRNLWHWCQTQRTGYANLIKGQETNLSPDRIKLLNEIDFQWVRNKTPGMSSISVIATYLIDYHVTNRLIPLLFAALKWDERFEQVSRVQWPRELSIVKSSVLTLFSFHF